MIDSKVSPLNSQSEDAPSDPTLMADESAEHLMDELFDGVELALEGDLEALEGLPERALPLEAEAAPMPELTLSFTEGGLPPVLLDRSAEDAVDVESSPLGELAPIAEEAAPPILEKRGWRQFWTLNRALLGAAGLMVLASLGLWLYQRQQAQVAATVPATVPAVDPAATAEAEFLEYLRRSLEVIAQNAPDQAPTATARVTDVAVALNSSGVNLPPTANNALPMPSATAVPSAPGSINVIERVYVPYPSAQASVAPGAVQPGSTAGGVRSSEGNVNPAIAPHVLLGVLELGERSAALFEIGGVPQRVYIGERIGNSGWSLVSVANEEAVVRRNGEVRTLYIGQKF